MTLVASAGWGQGELQRLELGGFGCRQRARANRRHDRAQIDVVGKRPIWEEEAIHQPLDMGGARRIVPRHVNRQDDLRRARALGHPLDGELVPVLLHEPSLGEKTRTTLRLKQAERAFRGVRPVPRRLVPLVHDGTDLFEGGDELFALRRERDRDPFPVDPRHGARVDGRLFLGGVVRATQRGE